MILKYDTKMKTDLEMCSKNRNRKIVEVFVIAKCGTFVYLSGVLRVSNVGQFACSLYNTRISRNALGVLKDSSK